MKTKPIFLLLFLFITLCASAIGQNKNRVDFIIDFTKERFILWPNDVKGKDNFVIAIVNDSSLYNELTPIIKKKPLLRKRKITLKYFSTFKEAAAIKGGIIYLNAKEGVNMANAIQSVSGKPVLIVGENFPFHQSMINFISLENNLSFEYNKELIEAQGLKITDELIKLSAKNELQWNKLLANAQQELEKEQALLAAKNKQIYSTQKALNNANENLNQKDAQLLQKNEIIDSAHLALSLQERELSLKKRESELKSHEIAEQKRHITIMIIAIVMGIVAIFFIYRSYTISRKTNVKLTDLNKSLKQHKDEIFLQKTIVEEKKKEITDSIYYAQRIQKSLLPSIKSFDDILKDNFILFKPKDIVSGDFYWFQKIGQDKVLFTVVDCTGHGVPGALMSVIGINQLNKIVHENKIIQPNTILQELDFATRATLRQANNEDNANDGMEMSICLLDTTSKTLHYSGAFNPLWIVSSQSNTTLEKYKTPALPNTNTALYEIPADKKSIAGMYKFHHQFTLHTVQLQKGDCIYLFSDGFADQFGGKDGKKFKKQQLKEKLVSVHTKNMLQQQDELNTVFESWKGNFEQIDDVCLMGIKIN